MDGWMNGGLGKTRGSHWTQRADLNKRERKQIPDLLQQQYMTLFGYISGAILVPLCFSLQGFIFPFFIYPLYNICVIVSLFLLTYVKHFVTLF